MRMGNGPVDGAQLSASLIEGGTGRETAKELRHAWRRLVTWLQRGGAGW